VNRPIEPESPKDAAASNNWRIAPEGKMNRQQQRAVRKVLRGLKVVR
jgi:hypothetical protein